MSVILDISHWQTVKDWGKLAEKVDGVYIKFSQGTGFKDPKANIHYANARQVGLPIGAYHFVINDNGIKQYEWFRTCMGDLEFQMPPMLDCEAYQAISALPVHELRYGNINQDEFLKMSDILSYAYPTEDIVDVIGRRLMGFQGFEYPTIYTNYSSGNVIFKKPAMSKYPLHIANWGVQKPLLPNVWKNKGTYYLWQDNVVDGFEYGIEGKVDHNVSGVEFYFKNIDTPPEPPQPPPASSDEIVISAYISGKTFRGTLKEEK